MTVGCAAAADLLSHDRIGDRISLQLSEGSADLTWITDASFRFRRTWTGQLGGVAGPPGDAHVTVRDEPAALLVSTNKLQVRLLKHNLLLAITDTRGTPLLIDEAPAERATGEVILRRSASEKTRYYGLGARSDESLDARGLVVEPSRAFLISSAGYGENHVAPGSYTFDLAKTRSGSYTTTIRGSDRVDFYFYYGPTPKDIFEEHLRVTGPMPLVAPSRIRSVTPTSLPTGAWIPPRTQVLSAYVRSIIHASMSGVLLPVFDVGLFEGPLADRAGQIGAVAPLVMNGRRDERFVPFLLTYTEEARERGFPIIHPLPMQYPADPEAHRHADEFLLGDEILIAPILTSSPQRNVYLPMGTWTNLRTNQRHKGRQSITIDAAPDELPMFLRNGSILPLLQSSGLMDLHYFPQLGAEFFIFEGDISDYSQVHAAPAADDVRLEIESKKAREYRWIVHHSARPRRISSGPEIYKQVNSPRQVRAGAWHWDSSTQNLMVQASVSQDIAHIINVSF